MTPSFPHPQLSHVPCHTASRLAAVLTRTALLPPVRDKRCARRLLYVDQAHLAKLNISAVGVAMLVATLQLLFTGAGSEKEGYIGVHGQDEVLDIS